MARDCTRVASEVVVAFDHFFDWIPVASIANNVVFLVAKAIFDCMNCKASRSHNPLFVHLNEKSYEECFWLMIPGVNLYIKFQKFGSPDSINPTSDIGVGASFDLFDVEYGNGIHVGHMIDQPKVQDLTDGGLFITTSRLLKQGFEALQEKFAHSKDEELKSDIKRCDAMMTQYYQACISATPTIVKNLIKGLLPESIIKFCQSLKWAWTRPDAKNFISSVNKLKKDECRFDTVNLKIAGGGFHTMARAVICREPPSEKFPDGVYDLIVGNVGRACEWHLFDENDNVLPFVLEGMTLKQVTDEQFVKDLVARSICEEEDSDGIKFYGTLVAYAKKEGNKNIRLIGWEKPPVDDSANKNKLLGKGIYKACASPLQKTGNCIYKSPEALIKAIIKLQTNRNSDRIMFMLLVTQWELDFCNVESDEYSKNQKRIYQAAVKEIQWQVKALAQLESKSEKEIIQQYCTNEQQKIFTDRKIFM